jgi:predicted transcriptional regulator
MTDRSIPIRLDDDTIDRLDRLAEALAGRAAGVKVARSSVMRVALERGLDSLEAELRIGTPKKHRKK